MTAPAANEGFQRLPNLASERFGAAVLEASDDFFAEKENLVRDAGPRWDPDLYTERGKWMDGWETRRRREEGHDWCLVRLGVPGLVSGVIVDTSHFTGNFPESFSLEACAAADDAPPARLLTDGTEWIELLPRTPLTGDAVHPFEISSPYRFTHLRLHIYPDGGVARLRVHGVPLPRAASLPTGEPVVLSALERGARVVTVSDSFYGAADKMLLSDAPLGMHDGWETRRRRGGGNDWAVVRLAAPGLPERVEVDTSFFRGNAPGACSVEAAFEPDAVEPEAGAGEGSWRPLVPRSTLEPDRRHSFDVAPGEAPVTHVRLQIYPDGGVARFRVHGRVDPGHRERAALAELNTLCPGAAERAFLDCCGSGRWAGKMAARRPFADRDALLAAAEEVADALLPDDWREAFAAHPPIGGETAERPRGERSAGWSREEQAGLAGAGDELLERLADATRRYRERFGHGFIVRASGRTGEELLALLEERLAHDREEELAVAAAEELAITLLRLEKLLQP